MLKLDLNRRKYQLLRTRVECVGAHLRKIDAVFAEWDGEDIMTLPEWVRPKITTRALGRRMST